MDECRYLDGVSLGTASIFDPKRSLEWNDDSITCLIKESLRYFDMAVAEVIFPAHQARITISERGRKIKRYLEYRIALSH